MKKNKGGEWIFFSVFMSGYGISGAILVGPESVLLLLCRMLL